MNFFRNSKYRKDLRMAQALFRVSLHLLKFLQIYFAERYDEKEILSPFVRGISAFAIGYCPARQISEKYILPSNTDGQIALISEPEYLDALNWMEHGICQMSSSDSRTQKNEAFIYCTALLEIYAFLFRAGNYERALQYLEHGIEFAECYVSEKLDSKTRDKLNFNRSLCLAYAGRFDEAIHAYPSKDILNAIINAKGRPATAGGMIDILPYALLVKKNAQDPNGRCGDDDIEYVNSWLADFYITSGSYPEAFAICLEDIKERKIAEKNNRHAVMAYLNATICASHIDLWEYAINALSTSYHMAQKILAPQNDSDAKLFYKIFFYYFQIYFFRPDLKEADFVLDRAMEFLDKRVAMWKEKNGSDTAVCEMDCDAKEEIMLHKAELLFVQGKFNESLEFSQWVVDSCQQRRAADPDKYIGAFDEFYIEALARDTLNLLYVYQNRTVSSDEHIQTMIRESINIIDEIKLITLDHMREDNIRDLQVWGDTILSYWIQFPDSAISAEQLYTFELNTKNIDPDIRGLQNTALRCEAVLSQSKTVEQERRGLWENYQKAMFEGGSFENSRHQFWDKLIALDAERYRLLKNSGYDLTYYDISTLQTQLGHCRAVLEFRKYTHYDLAHNTGGSSQYGAFLITDSSARFVSLGNAEGIETSVSEVLLDIQDADMIDCENVSANKLCRLEDALLAPFRNELLQIKELYIVPDNELYKVPFELMPMWNSGDAVEGGTSVKICYLTSARSILRGRKADDNYCSIKVIANPEFNIENDNKKDPAQETETLSEVPEDVRSVLLSAGISDLKYTEFEAETIANVFAENGGDVELVQGCQARKDNVFTKQSDILHFATHGFAILTQLDEKEQRDVPLGNMPYMERSRRIASCGDALLRCGLLLSGVDNWLHEAAVDGFDNGILTGMDILLENLSSCRLVVLSACSTGQGVVSDSGEGIEGLRSAFELAGVPALVCTLWDIDDFSTALFMTEFYRELHSTKNPLSALNAAKHTIRGMTYSDLERRGFKKQAENLFSRRMALSMEEKVFAHPKYWAGFIIHGAVL